jgi:hypothetical protein
MVDVLRFSTPITVDQNQIVLARRSGLCQRRRRTLLDVDAIEAFWKVPPNVSRPPFSGRARIGRSTAYPDRQRRATSRYESGQLPRSLVLIRRRLVVYKFPGGPPLALFMNGWPTIHSLSGRHISDDLFKRVPPLGRVTVTCSPGPGGGVRRRSSAGNLRCAGRRQRDDGVVRSSPGKQINFVFPTNFSGNRTPVFCGGLCESAV